MEASSWVAVGLAGLALLISIGAFAAGRSARRGPPGTPEPADARVPAPAQVEDGTGLKDGFGSVQKTAKLLLAALLVVSAFGILQPIVWRAVFQENPNSTSIDLATVITVSLALLSLLAGSVGIVLYEVISKQLEKTVKTAEDTLSQELERGVKAAEGSLGQARQKALAQLALEVSYQAWTSYDLMWRQNGYAASTEKEQEFQAFLSNALRNAQLALTRLDGLPADVLEGDQKPYFMACKNSVAYHLATQRKDIEKAKALVRELRQQASGGQRWRVEETFIWVYLRCSTPGDETWKAAVGALSRLMATDAPDDYGDDPAQWQSWHDGIRSRYQGVFSDGAAGLPTDLRLALTQDVGKAEGATQEATTEH